MRKRTAAFFLAVSLIISLFSGCASAPIETQVPTEGVTEAPTIIETAPATEEPTEAPTEVPTEPPTEAPTEPGPTLMLTESEVVLTEKGQTLEIYCGDVPLEDISWFCDDESVALFSRGTLVAINAGTTQVYATYRDQTVSCTVTCDVDPDAPMPKIDSKLLHAPRLAAPYVEDLSDTSFFDDAAFLGDSVTFILQQWHVATKAFGDATFLTRISLGLQNSLSGTMKINYQGKSLRPEEALEKVGAFKVFIMMGFNDLEVFGVEGAMEKWDEFLERILEKCPDIEIYIQSCTGTHQEGEKKNYTNAMFDEYNAALKVYCEENGYYFIDVAPYFKDFTNGIPTEYSRDQYVHMSNEGTAVWEKVLKAYAAEQKGET